MLTREEQEQILKLVQQILKRQKTRRTRVKTFVMSMKAAREAEQKDWDELRDLLKEVG